MPITATVTAGWTYKTGDTATASNLNALGIPTVKIPDGEVYIVDAGSLSSCGVQVDGDPNTGLAQLAGADTLSIVAGGAEIVRLIASQALFVNGTAANPSISFVGNANTGFNHDATNEIDVVVGGKLLATFSDSLVSIDGKLEAGSVYIGGAPVLSAGISPTTAFFFTDFFEGLSASGMTSTVSSGTVANGTTVITAQSTGIVRLTISGSASSAILHSVVPMAFGDAVIWRTAALISGTLSNGTNRYYILIGVSELGATEELSGGSGNAAWFEYDDSTSAQWRCVSRVTSTKETTTTATTVASSTSRQKFEIRNSGTTITFYIDGALVATHTTQVPAKASRVYPFIRMTATAGTPSSTIIDADSVEMQYAIART